MAAALAPACRSASPSLTLTFVGLPESNLPVIVTLSSVSLSGTGKIFDGVETSTAAASVHYPGDDTVVISIDRAALDARQGRLRFPLTATSEIDLDAEASTSVALGYTFSAHAQTGVHAGKDALLTFYFLGADGVDAGRPPLPDAGDGDGADASPPPTDASIPARCVVSAPRPASAATAGGAPAIGFANGLYGVAWTTGSGGGLVYNAVDAAGTLQNAADVTVVSPASAVTLSAPRLASLGSDLAIAYGRHDATGNSQAVVVAVVPGTGMVRSTPATGAGVADSAPREIGDLVHTATELAVISRRASSDAQTPGAIDLFNVNADPDTLSFVTSKSTPALAATRSTALAWSGRFVAGMIVEMTSAGGTMAGFATGDLTPGPGFGFTTSGDLPVVGIAGAGLSVAGLGDAGDVAVAWVDGQSCTGCSGLEVSLSVVRPDGTRPYAEVQVSAPSQIQKRFPHVVFDGSAIAVAWLEFESTTRAAVKLRRFDATLRPVGDAMDVGPAGTPQPVLADIGLVAAGPGEYGVVMSLFAAKQSFTHVICREN